MSRADRHFERRRPGDQGDLGARAVGELTWPSSNGCRRPDRLRTRAAAAHIELSGAADAVGSTTMREPHNQRKGRRKTAVRSLNSRLAKLKLRVTTDRDVNLQRLSDDLSADKIARIPELVDRWNARETTSLGELGLYGMMFHWALRLSHDGDTSTHGVASSARACSDVTAVALKLEWDHPQKATINAELLQSAFHLNRGLLVFAARHFLPSNSDAEAADAWHCRCSQQAAAEPLYERCVEANEKLLRLDPWRVDREHRADLLAMRMVVERAWIAVGDCAACARHPNAINSADRPSTAPLEEIWRELNQLLADSAALAKRPAVIEGRISALLSNLTGVSRTKGLVRDLIASPLPRSEKARTLVELACRSDNEVSETLTLLNLAFGELSTVSSAEFFTFRAAVGTTMSLLLAELVTEENVGKVFEIASKLCGLIPADPWPASANHIFLFPGSPCKILQRDGPNMSLNEFTVDIDNTVAPMVIDHAEEKVDQSPDLKALRDELSRQFEPVLNQLAAAGNPPTVHAFGFLKHVPLGNLKFDGRTYASKYTYGTPVPNSRTRAHRATDSETGGGRIALLDSSFTQLPTCNNLDRNRVRSFDSRNCNSDDAIQQIFGDLDQFEELIFFGHGSVEQTDYKRRGLVVGDNIDRPRVLLPESFLSRDLSHLKWAAIIACGAGQGSVLVEGVPSAAECLLEAGAQAVIAPRWPIENNRGRLFLDAWLKKVDSGLSPRDACVRVTAGDPKNYFSIECFQRADCGGDFWSRSANSIHLPTTDDI